MSDVIDQALSNLEDIKESRNDGSDEDEVDSSGSDGDCPSCGSDNVGREVTSATGANRTKNNLVGGRNMRVKRVCRDCGNSWSA